MLKINAKNNTTVARYIDIFRTYTDYLNFNGTEKIDYLFLNDQAGITVFHIFDKNLEEKASQDPGNVIFIDNSHENINTKNILEKLPTEKFYIILSCGKWDSSYYDLPISYINLTRYMYFYEYAMFVFNQQHILFYQDNTYNFDYPKQHHFLSTTGMVKDVRDKFVDIMQKNLKTDNFIFRYSGVDLGKPADMIDVVSLEPNKFNSYIEIAGYEDYYYNVSYSLPIEMYNTAYFNLVLEGDIDCPYQFIPTEKIIKVLFTGMPFVVVGSPLFLAEIKKLGFRTYHELWDESYDCEFDCEKRMQKIVNLCNHLIEFDWIKNRDKLIEIGNHNRNCFSQLKNIFLKEYDETFKQLKQFDFV